MMICICSTVFRRRLQQAQPINRLIRSPVFSAVNLYFMVFSLCVVSYMPVRCRIGTRDKDNRKFRLSLSRGLSWGSILFKCSGIYFSGFSFSSGFRAGLSDRSDVMTAGISTILTREFFDRDLVLIRITPFLPLSP